MTEEEEEASRSTTKSTRRLYLSVAFFCVTASLVLFTIAVHLGIQRRLHERNESYLVATFATIATLLFFVGGILLTACWKKEQHSSTPQVVISLIPVEDLEKSPAHILPHSHIPRRQPFFLKASPLDLPDYFTVALHIDELYPSVDVEDWTENVPETPPPSYEQALEMST